MKKGNCSTGMTLVEVIVSMAIFSIIAMVFLTTFTSSFMWISGAGDKAEAYSLAQVDVEERIAKGDGSYSDDLIITFNSKDYSIRGGLVETNQIVGKKNSNLKTFVPLIPTITINPLTRYEGDINTRVAINGMETSFNSTSIVDIFDYTGKNKIEPNIKTSVKNDKELTFDLPVGLVNQDYIIKVTTKISGKGDQISRAKYIVQQPKFVSVGGSYVYISADGKNWVDKSYSLPSISNELNDITSNYNGYVAVGQNGFVLSSREKKSWVSSYLSSENLTGVTWSVPFEKFFAVGEDGGIYSSVNGTSWSSKGTISSKLNDIVSTTFSSGTSVLTAVGSVATSDESIRNSLILQSTDGMDWSGQTYFEGELKAVTSGDNSVVAVGQDDIFYSINGSSWSQIGLGGYELNDIAFASGKFIAVGDSGVIITSTNAGSTWNLNKHWSGYNFKGICSFGNEFIIVGNDGVSNSVVLYSEDGSTWEYKIISGVILNSVSGK